MPTSNIAIKRQLTQKSWNNKLKPEYKRSSTVKDFPSKKLTPNTLQNKTPRLTRKDTTSAKKTTFVIDDRFSSDFDAEVLKTPCYGKSDED